MKNSIKNTILGISKTLLVLSLIPSFMLLSGCLKSEAEICVDEQSHLWDKTRGKSREENQAYWTAVENCRKKYK